ncbi:hypothetical protein AJ80_06621 [Polytolypa hystricis UAMH7299]|uniref:RING-type E3 ubiquitin transferase n=1 Tax=Polytolypa hystricis (strain UAMH7299) TaxID=1447883 RepID=A0A2B7XVU2_POLH7|nr:hypothetical protein AJ80_06621 [Polytolypa hystricis UAMH7299]
MADTPPSAAPPTGPSRGSNTGRGGRRRGGGGGPTAQSEGQQRGGRGGGRGRGYRGGRGGAAQFRGPRARLEYTADSRGDGVNAGEPPDPALRSLGTSGDRLTGDAVHAEGEKAGVVSADKFGKGPAKSEEADDGEVCFICASPVEHTSVSPCNHRTCHICALRLRALYKTKACAHCRTESTFVIFTDDPLKRYEDFKDTDFIRSDDNLGIKYETDVIFEDTVLLLRYNCPDTDCDVACLGWPDLHRHVKSKHSNVMCDLCTRNKKVFTHEHELFTVSQLRKHERHGDDNPGALDQSGFRGHPECGFCRQRFYGDDELYAHCRDKHERCHICDRRTGGSQRQYYVNYNALEDHFQKDHFLCLDKECLEKKFVVFESQLDLKGHQLESHPAGLTKDARRDARLVDLSDFDFRSPYQPQRPRREGRGAGRGRDPNSEPVPASSAQPMRRDEVAYQRQMAIQSAQSVSTRNFGGQLTASEPQTVRAPARPTPPSTPTVPSALPTIESLDLGQPTVPRTPHEESRHLAHTTVVNRASTLLRNDRLKLNEFRTKVSQYRTSAIGANDLIESFFSLFDASSTEIGKLIKELAELYEDESKRSSLLKAWNDWRAINEDYPSLPAPSGVLPSSSLGNTGGGKRVLRLKSSTAQSSRSSVGRTGSLPGLFDPRSSSNPFPPLAASNLGSAASKSRSGAAWGGAQAGARPTTNTRITTVPSRAGPRPAPPTTSRAAVANSSDAFPALPTAPKPNTLMAGLTRGTVRWDNRSPPTQGSAWASGADPTPAESGVEGTEKKGKGKKGKGKQLLYHFG